MFDESVKALGSAALSHEEMATIEKQIEEKVAKGGLSAVIGCQGFQTAEWLTLRFEAFGYAASAHMKSSDVKDGFVVVVNWKYRPQPSNLTTEPATELLEEIYNWFNEGPMTDSDRRILFHQKIGALLGKPPVEYPSE